MNIRQATRAYEAWLARQVRVIPADVRRKHARMAENPFVFLRGTFYRWMQQWPAVCPTLADAPVVLAVGDLHIENFGTWRDLEGRLIWGVNDVDEAHPLPYTNDLVRLATSSLLAIRTEQIALTRREVCTAILEGYLASLEQEGRPVVLAEHRRWLRQIALNELRDPVTFWAKLNALGSFSGSVPHTALRMFLPDPGLRYRVVRRIAGVGSLGRPRFVALAHWGGGLIAREAKALVPSAALWATGDTSSVTYCNAVLKRAIHVPDPFFAATERWIVRRLAPDCSRIELADLPKKRDEAKLLRAMGWETANIHLGTPRTRIGRHLKNRPNRWLERAASDMAESTVQDWQAWSRRT